MYNELALASVASRGHASDEYTTSENNRVAVITAAKAGTSRRMRRAQKSSRCARPPEVCFSRMPVIKKPEITKKTSTPTKPPPTNSAPTWKATTANTATPRRPSMSSRKPRRAAVWFILPIRADSPSRSRRDRVDGRGARPIVPTPGRRGACDAARFDVRTEVREARHGVAHVVFAGTPPADSSSSPRIRRRSRPGPVRAPPSAQSSWPRTSATDGARCSVGSCSISGK